MITQNRQKSNAKQNKQTNINQYEFHFMTMYIVQFIREISEICVLESTIYVQKISFS